MVSWGFCEGNQLPPLLGVNTVVAEECVPERTVLFNVRGVKIEVETETVRKIKNNNAPTLLEAKLDELGTDKSIFIDVNPERFHYILDWYRDGEIHLPAGMPVKAILKDAQFLGLPSSVKVKVDGSSEHLESNLREETVKVDSSSEHLESNLREETVSTITKHWPSLPEYLDRIVRQVQEEVSKMALHAKSLQKDVVHAMEPPAKTVIALTEHKAYDGGLHEWIDPKNVCNKERLRVLVAELRKRGFECDVDPPEKKQTGWSPLQLRVGLAGGKLGFDSNSLRSERPGIRVR